MMPNINLETAVFNRATSGELLAARAGYSLAIYGLLLYNVAAQTVTLMDGPDFTLLALPLLPGPAPIQLTLGFLVPLWELRVGQPLGILLGGPTQVTGVVKYVYQREQR